MGVFLFLVDGLGLGPEGPHNPVSLARTPFIDSSLAGRLLLEHTLPLGLREGPLGFVVATDACLGVPGLPQSATGQTSLLTGENAQAIAGRHVNARPTGRVKDLLATENLLGKAQARGFRAGFLNAYRPGSLEALEGGSYKPSATTVAALGAGLRLKDFEDLRKGEALYHDMTHETLVASGYDLPGRSPWEAGKLARRLAKGLDLGLYEFFLTDMAGHRQDKDRSIRLLENIDSFLEALGPDDSLCLIMTSDHGNIEDLSRKGHTRNPVPTLVLGGPRDGRERLKDIKTISDLAPCVLDYLEHQRRWGR